LAKINESSLRRESAPESSLYSTGESGGLANAEQLHGKEMSLQQYVDAEAAWDLVKILRAGSGDNQNIRILRASASVF
jgi:AICAR transformylase/IMP cyclohydrolase PurH